MRSTGHRFGTPGGTPVWPDAIEIRDADGQLMRVVTRAQALEIVEQAIGEAEAGNGNALFGFVEAIECCVNAAQFLLDARALDSRNGVVLPDFMARAAHSLRGAQPECSSLEARSHRL